MATIKDKCYKTAKATYDVFPSARASQSIAKCRKKSGVVNMSKKKKVKYKLGQLVYSYQNKTKKCPINYIKESEDGAYDHRYRLTLPTGNSNWINEKSLYLTKK